MTGIVLAGGKNSRMGINKSFLNINGSTIIDNTISIFKKIFNEIIIVTNTPKDFEYLNVKVIADVIPNKGPLGGIYTGLLEAKNQYSFITACDMPFINERLIRYLISRKGYDIVIPEMDGKYEPLFAMYSKKCLRTLEINLQQEKLKIRDITLSLNVKEINIEELKRIDNNLLFLTNVNTPEEYYKALKVSVD